MKKFTDLLNQYLELASMDETEHGDFEDGYTNKAYYDELQTAEDELNSFVEGFKNAAKS